MYRSSGADSRAGREHGFTFIELMVGVAIGALLLTALYATFFTATRAMGSVDTTLGVRIEAGRMLDRLAGEVRSSTFATGDPLTLFAGDQKGMSSELVLTAWSGAAAGSGPMPSSDLIAVRYAAKNTLDGLSLVREAWSPYTGEHTSVVAVEVLESFEVSFYDGHLWTKAWDASVEGRLPVAVKAAVVIPGGERYEMTARAMLR